MASIISTGNEKSQDEIFLGEIATPEPVLLQLGMAKSPNSSPPQIYLGDWLDLLETEIGKAAELAGCKQPYISNIIAGRKKNINVMYLLRLSDSLGVTVNDFYRPLPKKSELSALKNLSAKAQATILEKQRRKA